MKKKTFLSKFAARFMAAALMVSSVAMTGCYKDDGLDVTFPGGSVVIPDATYAISGSVNDFETGNAVNLTSVISSVGTATVDGNGAFHVTLTKADVPENGVTVNLTFKAEGYDDVQRSVFVKHIADGTSVVYPLSVTLRKTVVYEPVVYNLKFIVKNAETGEVISDVTPVVEGTPDANGNYAAGEYIVKTPAVEGKYYASATAVILPEAEVVKGENNVRTNIIEISVIPVTVPEPEVEFAKVYGEVLDSRGVLATAQRIYLKDIAVEPAYNASNFSFTVEKEKLASASEVIAEVKNATATGVKETKASITPSDVDAYYIVLNFDFVVIDGQEFNIASTSTEETAEATTQLEINYMNSNEEAVNYTVEFPGYAGTKYADYSKLLADVTAACPEAEIRNLVWEKIKELVPEAKEEFTNKIYEQTVSVPGWTLLNNADINTTTKFVTYELNINGTTISFVVETINDVAISVTEKNMTHMGHDHSHGHGHGDSNNAGGGIIVSE